MPQIVVQLDQPNLSMGVTWVEDFHALVNAERLQLDRAALKIMGSDPVSATRVQALDIAQIHTEHQAAINFLTHDSGLLPVGWQNMVERIKKLTDWGGSENLINASSFYYSTRTYSFPSPQLCFDAWWASPGHRDNMIRAFEPSWLSVYSDFGVAQSNTAPDAWGYAFGEVGVTYITHKFLILEEVSMDVILSQSWESNGCIIAMIDQQYMVNSYTHVRSSNTAVYKLALSASHEAKTGCAVAAQHETATHYGISTSFEAGYTQTAQIPKASFISIWDTRKAVVSAANTAEYRLAVSFVFESTYASSAKVRESLTTDYGSSPNVRYLFGTEYSTAPRATVLFVSDYGNAGLVRAEQQAPYSAGLMLAIGHVASSQSASTVRRSLESAYTTNAMLMIGHQGVYGNTPNVSASLTSSYEDSTKVRFEHVASYAVKPNVQMFLETWYQDLVRVNTLLQTDYASSTKVATSETSGYSSLNLVSGANEASSTLPSPIRASHEGLFNLSVLNPVRGVCDNRYSLDGAVATFSTLAVTLTHKGKTTRVQDGYVNTSKGDPGYRFEVKVDDLQLFASIEVLDPIIVDFAGTIYNLVVTSKTIDRSSPVGTSAAITGLSPVYLQDLPYAVPVSYAPTTAKLMSEIVQEALGQSVTWEVVDWMVPKGRAQVASSPPLNIANSLLASIRATIQSNEDGTLVARYDYPTNWDAVHSIAPAHYLGEAEDLLTLSVSYEYRKGYNRFGIRDSDTSYSDNIAWDIETGVATVTPYPYRSSWTLATTSEAGINIEGLGENVETLTDIVEFKGGVGSLSKPIIEIVSMVWLSSDLGGVSFEPYSSQVQSGDTVNSGYGVAKITYKSKSYKFHITAPTVVELAQLLVKEN